MNLSIEDIIKETKGMSPKQFESYAQSNDIFLERDEVGISEDYYAAILPDYDKTVYSLNGKSINFTNI